MADTLITPASELVEALRLRANVARLLANIADKGECRGCRREIYWVLHRNGKRVPYDVDGMNHFASCPAAKEFKRA